MGAPLTPMRVSPTTLELPDGSVVESRLYARFLLAEGNSDVKATARMTATMAWRREHRADEALRRPLPQFWSLKSFVPHCIHGRDRGGRPVIWSKPSGMDLKALAE